MAKRISALSRRQQKARARSTQSFSRAPGIVLPLARSSSCRLGFRRLAILPLLATLMETGRLTREYGDRHKAFGSSHCPQQIMLHFCLASGVFPETYRYLIAPPNIEQS